MNRAEALKILELPSDKDPKEQDIKKAFKKKAVKLHPDVNKHDNAEAQFKELNAAHEYLINPPAPQNFAGQYSVNDGSFADFFRNVAGPRVRFSVSPIQKNIKISFKDSVLGSQQKIKIDKTSRCDSCLCSNCGGTGQVERTIINANMIFTQMSTCNKCKGKGRLSDNCKKCTNTGIVRKTSEFSVNIPGGITNGVAMRLGGFGNIENHNGILFSGDIILTVSVKHDKDMHIQGANVISIIDISLLEALRGIQKTVRTVLGETVISIKKGTKHKDTIILKKHGVEKRGNHVFMISVLYPKETDKLINILEDKTNGISNTV